MFEHARLTLTAWYLGIIMIVSLLFSLIIYTGVNAEYRQFEQREKVAQEYEKRGLPIPRKLTYSRVDPVMIDEARQRLIHTLGLVNAAIFVIAGGAGYFLAGRTMQPIKKMVDEQHRFIADASHELRTPLTTLRSEIEVGLRNKKMTLAHAKELLESNLEEVLSLQSLSEHLLELAQSGELNGKVHFSTVSLPHCLDLSVRKLERLAEKKNITISKNIDEINITGIQDRIIELFVILLDNAIKYSPEKSVITVVAKKKKVMAEITISDQGIGIADEDLPHIFDRFYRASKSRSKEKVAGYGLGLSIAKKIVKAHHGEILVKSQINKGTTFTIHLPVK